MKHSLVKDEMTFLLENINEQFDLMNQHEIMIPQIEIDLFMRNIQKLYESSIYLNKYNSKHEQEPLKNKEIVIENQQEPIQSRAESKSQVEEFKIEQLKEKEINQDIEKPLAEKPEDKQESPVLETYKEEVEEVQAHQIKIVKEEIIEEQLVQEKSMEEVIRSLDLTVSEEQKTPEPPTKTTTEDKIKEHSYEFRDILEEKEEELDLFTNIKVNEEIGDLNKKLAEARNTQSIVEKLQSKRIDSLKSVIGINDKFYFINELFSGNSQKYEDIIYTLNNFKKLEDAMVYFSTLKYKFSWDEDSEAYKKLCLMLERKFELSNA